jgi:hypothetical protein
MAVVGVDCHVILDGQGYYLAPRSYQVARPRVRRTTLTVQGSERWVDQGPGKRVWRFTVLALNDLQAYGGGPVGMSGEAIRAVLEASYARVGTALAFIDPRGDSYGVRFDGLVEVVRDVRTQVVSPGYLLAVELVEV